VASSEVKRTQQSYGSALTLASGDRVPRQRAIVCGGRKYKDSDAVRQALVEHTEEGAVIVTGGAMGADALARRIGLDLKRGHIIEEHDAKWERYGKAAGPVRNQEMVNLGADLCIAFPGGKGTRDCVQRCLAAGIPVKHRG
jgi:predicted Rossmann-fold nucleotide-binding protein